MAGQPSIKEGDWIRVGSIDCVVSRVWPSTILGDCEVVLNPSKPTNLDAKWTGEHWEFVQGGDYGGDADKHDRLRPYLRILKSGHR